MRTILRYNFPLSSSWSRYFEYSVSRTFGLPRTSHNGFFGRSHSVGRTESFWAYSCSWEANTRASESRIEF